MDLTRADYSTIIMVGSFEDLNRKMEMSRDEIGNIVNRTDETGTSLLETALTSRKFDIAKYLLDNGAKVNVVTEDKCNEFHCLAANINMEGALELAEILKEKGVDLSLQDLKYGNSALFTLCYEVFKRRLDDRLKFIVKCLQEYEHLDDENKAGYSVKQIIKDRGTDEMKKLVEKRRVRT